MFFFADTKETPEKRHPLQVPTPEKRKGVVSTVRNMDEYLE